MQLIKHIAIIAALAFPAAALAHGGGEHIMGTVKSISEKGLTVETKDKKEVKVAFDEKTKFEKSGATSTVKELSAGERVVVHTTKKQGSTEPVAVLVKFGAEHDEHAEHTEHAQAPAAQSVSLSVTDQGFTPDHVKVKKGEPVDLVITRKTDKTCATAINIPDFSIKRELPLNEAVTVSFTPKKNGEIKYSCGMGMLGGVLTVE
ncbi:MAG TPA: cupredoxin domain-containing protein [Candidatus Sulfotelmatobacter sp.]|nr:cupredoxin domain-containing protein [Candidatus Sulfotelmatobacter sp.]